ncbi:MAG TPA: D-2-hydroxyacid dehydrogenase [Candidatus Dormibacteraeota bacterium]|nr:D-2-hydroxyacid dehydrogenase [Candidatus Dormibacteraeota bacterium]
MRGAADAGGGRSDAAATVLVIGARDADDLPRVPAVPGVAWRFAREDEALVAALPEADVVFAWRQPQALERHWRLARRLRWLQAATAGAERSLFPAIVESDVVVTTSAGVFDRGMAEYAFALLLYLAKDVRMTVDLQRQRDWRHRTVRGLEGMRLLVVGAGPIGRAVARLGAAFGMFVTVAARTTRDDRELGRIHAATELPELMAGADAVVLVLPHTAETRGLVGHEALAHADSALLVNVGRGSTLDLDGVIEALDEGRLAGAALDVFPDEPLPPDSPLWLRHDVLVSPHIGGDVEGFEARLVDAFEANLRRHLAGEPLEHVVDKGLGYPPSH